VTETVNIHETNGRSVTVGLPNFLEDTRRQLIALRVKHGADSPIGHRCSNIIELLQNYEKAIAADHEASIAKQISKQMLELERLLAQ
jgi:hypothetical protein